MRVLDVFSGIGGMSLGLERAGLRTVAFAESDPFARAVLRRHWPGIPCYEDVRDVSAPRLRADGVPEPDLLCGGFPCQDVSPAGRGGGIDGSRSGLWAELLRLVQECRPGWVLVENVPALRVRGADRVLAGLEAAGYACWPAVVGAAHAGAPHRRARSFILAHAAGAGLEGWLPRADPTQPGVHPAGCGDWPGSVWPGSVWPGSVWPGSVWPGEVWPPEPGLGRVVDGLPARMDRKRRLTALGNAVVPAVAMILGQAILSAQAAVERTRSANDLRNLDTFGPTTARQ